ncbi:MAG: FAD-binding protein [Nitrospirae bacterium]|nr:FAD-binding protein [Nitrospirota bacterium]
MKNKTSDLRIFDRILPAGMYSTEIEDLICYGYDASGHSGVPLAVVWPENTQNVSDIMEIAYKNDLKIVPRGAGSGMTGGSVPASPSIIISMERMNKILEIDTANMTALVQPGVINGHLQRELKELGYFYPPDPASMEFCTIGGNVAENAGGPSALKYGVTKDYVLAIEAVLADGSVINTGVKTAKGVVGYDLTSLLVGSEGTLALFTKIRLRIMRSPEKTVTMMALFENIGDAGNAITEIMTSGILPRNLEIMDRTTISAINSFKPSTLPNNVDAALLIELDSSPETIKRESKEIAHICAEYKGNINIARNPTEQAELWTARRSISPALYRINHDKINEDIVVPITMMTKMLLKLKELSHKTGITIASFGHAGDGNIHVNVMPDKSKKGDMEIGESLVKEIFQITLDMGGTISGEHGIGMTKSKYIGMEIEAPVLDIMRGIKKLMDHKNLINPGKIFPS